MFLGLHFFPSAYQFPEFVRLSCNKERENNVEYETKRSKSPPPPLMLPTMCSVTTQPLNRHAVNMHCSSKYSIRYVVNNECSSPSPPPSIFIHQLWFPLPLFFTKCLLVFPFLQSFLSLPSLPLFSVTFFFFALHYFPCPCISNRCRFSCAYFIFKTWNMIHADMRGGGRRDPVRYHGPGG